MAAPLLSDVAAAVEAPASSQRGQITYKPYHFMLTYVNQALDVGLTRPLEEGDVPDPHPTEQPKNSRCALANAFESRRRKGRPSLILSLLDADGCLLLYSSLLHVFDIIFQFIPPLIIKNLILFVQSTGPDRRLEVGVFYGILFVVAPLIQAVASNQVIVECRRLGIRAQGALCCMIFEKTLRLSQPAAASYGAGALANIMQVDTNRFFDYYVQLNYLWSMPFMLIVGVIFVYQRVKIAAFTPVLITILLSPFSNRLVRQAMNIQRQLNLMRDKRVKVLTEVLQASRLVKMLAWESHIKGMIMGKRAEELVQVSKFMLFQVWNTLIWQGVPTLLPLATFGTYVLLGGQLDVGDVFSTLALLDLVRTPMNTFPQALGMVMQTQVGIDRIQRLLLAQEVEDMTSSEERSSDDLPMGAFPKPIYKRHPLPHSNGVSTVAMVGAEFRWPSETTESHAAEQVSQSRSWLRLGRQRSSRSTPLLDENGTSLVNVSAPITLRASALEIAHGKFVFVVGSVGAGKSTLLAGMLSELPQVAGRVEVGGSIAYCPQIPWILHGTVTDNITFGDKFETERFESCVQACALAADLAQLQDGAATIIGERGINLSGGQKARISLARAAYASASVYILDDPLAAVDAHVATHLVEECLSSSQGLLRHSTRILVTHQLQHMQAADLVVVVSKGEVVAARPPAEFTPSELQAYGIEVTADDGKKDDKSSPSVKKKVSPTPPRTPSRLDPSGQQGAAASPVPGQPQPRRARNVNEEEDREVGHVSAAIWLTYARAMGVWMFVFLMASFTAGKVLLLCGTLWLAAWTNDVHAAEDMWYSLSVYALFSVGTVVTIGVRMQIFRWTSLKVSRNAHDDSLWTVLRSPMWWLDTTPTGRIVNRFSQDLQRLDMMLIQVCNNFLDNTFNMIVSCGLILSAVPFLFVMMAPLGYLYYATQKKYRASGRELQRIMMLSRSPMYQGLNEAILGVSSIRAFGRMEHFNNLNMHKASTVMRLMFFIISCNRWMCIRMRLISIAFLAVSAFYLVFQDYLGAVGFKVSGAVAGLMLRYAVQITTNLEGVLMALTNTEMSLVSLERISAYAKLTKETALELDTDTLCGAWPQSGEVVFDAVEMRYGEHLPVVLKGVSFRIPGGTSIGVVGRTGSGKSSLFQAMFRMYELQNGRILIDGVDISSLGLHTLRSRLSIIPQDPIGFSGSLRFNLDPFNSNQDKVIWHELEKVQLAEFFKAKDEGLDYHLTSGGDNLSVGQRQLVCAARAFLRDTRILVLDEATASVDFKTDAFIQQVLREVATTRKLTTITIAHRINTILGSDNVLVMDAGLVAEMGPTHRLARDSASIFHGLVCEAEAMSS